jgi:hypothetical protein
LDAIIAGASRMTTPSFVVFADACNTGAGHDSRETQRSSSSAVSQGWGSGPCLSASSATKYWNLMPNAASDVEGKVEEEGNEPRREVQNSKENLSRRVLSEEILKSYGMGVIDTSKPNS